jgi:hypothetical protein
MPFSEISKSGIKLEIQVIKIKHVEVTEVQYSFMKLISEPSFFNFID